MMSTKLIDILQQKLLHDIPLTQYMGIRVSHYCNNELHINASLEKNINHRQTAFGGSISSLATLAGWGIVYLKFQELNIKAGIVIQQGNTNYLLPITNDFTAVCKIDSLADFDKFITTLKRKGVARIKLNVSVMCNAQLAAEFSGVFVAKMIAD